MINESNFGDNKENAPVESGLQPEQVEKEAKFNYEEEKGKIEAKHAIDKKLIEEKKQRFIEDYNNKTVKFTAIKFEDQDAAPGGLEKKEARMNLNTEFSEAMKDIMREFSKINTQLEKDLENLELRIK